MIQTKTLSRELALLILGQISEDHIEKITSFSLDALLNKALQTLMQHCREGLDSSANKLEIAQQHFLETDFEDCDKSSIQRIRKHLNDCLIEAENVLNGLSASIEFPRLLALSDQDEIRTNAIKRVTLVLDQKLIIDTRLDSVMEGWRLKRLPRIDQDILRLAFVDLMNLETPVAVACNEAVELAHRYSDEQGRRMINGVLRRLQDSCNSSTS